jgi:hypothetical protein
MKTNPTRLNSLVLWFIVLLFGIDACAPSASLPAPTSLPTSSDINPCDVSNIDITDVSWFQEPDGAWRVVGMMHNNSSQPIAKVLIGALTRKKNDELVYPEGPKGETIGAYPSHLLPGEQAPFSAWIKREIPALDHFTIEKKLCVIADPAERLQLQERGGQLLVDDDGLAQVTLEVLNPGPQTALINGMMVGVFDASDHLISAVDAEITPRILASGESGPVRATLALPPGGAAQVKSYKLYMDPFVTESAPELLDPRKDLQVNAQYFDAVGNFHLVGQIINAGTQPMMVSVQATLYADDARTAVVDATFMNTLIPLAPGESMPFDLTDWQVLIGKADLREALSKQDAAVALRVEPFHTWVADTSVTPLAVNPEPPAFGAQEAVFTGTVKNDTGHNIILGTVTVTLRDKVSGKITATGQAPVDIVNILTDGEARGYLIAIPVRAGFDPQTVEFEITASGQGT